MSDAYICRFSDVCIFAFRLFDALSHSSRNQLTGLNHFSLAAYGFQLPLPTLNQVRHHNWPKAEYGMRSVALFRWHFQPLAEVHFRGAHLVEPISRLKGPPFRTHRAQLRQWAQDNFVYVFILCSEQSVNNPCFWQWVSFRK